MSESVEERERGKGGAIEGGRERGKGGMEGQREGESDGKGVRGGIQKYT